MSVTIDEQPVFETCRDLWDVTLGLRLERQDRPAPAEEDLLASYVKISGDWKGAILLECPQSVSRHAATMLFGADADEPSKEELQDAANEMARMLGRRLQPVVAPTGKVSSSKTAVQGPNSPSLSAMKDRVRLELSCEGRPVRLSILESIPETAPA
jgi:hypothetical protein